MFIFNCVKVVAVALKPLNRCSTSVEFVLKPATVEVKFIPPVSSQSLAVGI